MNQQMTLFSLAAVAKVVNTLFPRPQLESPETLSPFSFSAIASYYDENVYVVDATLDKKLQELKHQLEAPKSLGSHIRHLVQLLKIPYQE